LMKISIVKVLMRFFVLAVNKTSKTKEYIQKWECTIQFYLKGGGTTSPFCIEFKNGIARYHNTEVEKPDLSIETDIKTFPKLMKGEINPQEAYLFQKYRFKGSIMDASKFNYLIKLLQESRSTLFSIARSLRIIK